MKRLSLITLLILLISSPGYSQFWIEFGWHEPHCRQCLSMAQTLRLNRKQAVEYQKIVHKYGQRIEKEARRDYKHWDKVARKIYELRMERDKKIRRILAPQQFELYVNYSRQKPQRIHDHRGWYENPYYANRMHSPEWRRYEDRYWTFHWDISPARPHYNKKPAPAPRYDNRPKPHRR